MTTLRFTLKNLEGELLPNTQFKISAGYPDDTYDPDLELPANTLFTTDNNGEALVTLAPLSVPYYLTRATDTLDDMIAFKFFVPNSATVLEADFTYVDLGSHLHTLADNSMYTFIETKVTLANAVEQVTISAIAASEAASAATTSANAASSSATAAQTAAESAATDVAGIASSLDVHTNDATAHSQYHRKDAIANDSDALWCGTAGGTANALTLALPASPIPQVYPAYKDGTRFTFKASADNTLAVTVNIGGLGVKNVKKNGGIPLIASDIKAGGVYEIIYNGSEFNIPGAVGGHDNELVYIGKDAVVEYVSVSQVKLSSRGRSKLFINGRNENIPLGGITISNSGLAANTLYYLYAYMSGGSMAVEAVTTLYDVDSTTGGGLKFNDSTRALVGMLKTTSGGLFDSYLVRSWYHDRGTFAIGRFNANRSVSDSVASAEWVELNSEIRTNFLVWYDDIVSVQLTGGALIDAGTSDDAYGFLALAFDGIVAADGASIIGSTAVDGLAANNWTPISTYCRHSSLSEGAHYVTVVGLITVTAGSGIDLVCLGSGSVGMRTFLQVSTLPRYR